MLRDASHRLGRFEAEGERRWKNLTGEARREALQLLRRLENCSKEAGSSFRALRATASGGFARRAVFFAAFERRAVITVLPLGSRGAPFRVLQDRCPSIRRQNDFATP